VFNESFFQNFAAAVGTLRRGLQNVIPHARIGSSNAIEDVIERDFGLFRIAVLAGFDELFGVVQSRSVDKHKLLLFRCWVEEVAIHNERFRATQPILLSQRSSRKANATVGRPPRLPPGDCGGYEAAINTRHCQNFLDFRLGTQTPVVPKDIPRPELMVDEQLLSEDIRADIQIVGKSSDPACRGRRANRNFIVSVGVAHKNVEVFRRHGHPLGMQLAPSIRALQLDNALAFGVPSRNDHFIVGNLLEPVLGDRRTTAYRPA